MKVKLTKDSIIKRDFQKWFTRDFKDQLFFTLLSEPNEIFTVKVNTLTPNNLELNLAERIVRKLLRYYNLEKVYEIDVQSGGWTIDITFYKIVYEDGIIKASRLSYYKV